MKIEPCEKIYLEKYEVNVKPYLSYAEIQNIANEAVKYQTWAERKNIIDYMLMCYATDAKREEIDEIGIDDIVSSGLLDEIRDIVVNCYDIYSAIQHEESIVKQIALVMENLPKVAKEAVEKVKIG